jgi:DNA-binding transcriptional MerR regulator
MTSALTTGQVALLAKVNLQTVRYYERLGLLAPDGRRPSGYRQYSPEAVQRIRFIKRSQELGFKLEEIRGLLELRAHPNASCEAVRRKTEGHLSLVLERKAHIARVESILRDMIGQCHEGNLPEGCPILRSLDEDEIPPDSA